MASRACTSFFWSKVDLTNTGGILSWASLRSLYLTISKPLTVLLFLILAILSSISDCYKPMLNEKLNLPYSKLINKQYETNRVIDFNCICIKCYRFVCTCIWKLDFIIWLCFDWISRSLEVSKIIILVQ